MLNHIKSIALLSAILSLTSGCVSLPPELRYIEPITAEHGVATVVGAKTGGFFSTKVVRLIGVDEQFVGGVDGVAASKVVNVAAGNRELVVEFNWGAEYVGREFISFEAVRDVNYRLAFEYPVTSSKSTTSSLDASADQASSENESVAESGSESPSAADPDAKDQAEEPAEPNHNLCWVWVEDSATGARVSDKVLMHVQYIQTIYIPIVI